MRKFLYNFLIGMGSIFDLGGTSWKQSHHSRNHNGGFQEDWKNLTQDWRNIGNDMRIAIKKVMKEDQIQGDDNKQ